jgi:hypothetical protein
MTDPYVELKEEADVFPSMPAPIAGSSQLRMRAIEAAVASARAGVAFDILEAAGRYVDFALGKEVTERLDSRSFREQLKALMEAWVLSEQTDMEKLRHDVSEVFGEVEDSHWPKIEGKPVHGPGPPWPKGGAALSNPGPGSPFDSSGDSPFEGMAGMSLSGAPGSSSEGMTVQFGNGKSPKEGR